MKELNEYKAEIFRRSEEKKRQIRKNRRIALGVGLSLCLCAVLTVAVAPLIPLGLGGMAPKAESSGLEWAVADDATKESPEQAFVVTDPEAAARVLAILEKEETEHTLNKETLDEENNLADQAETDEYRLILYCPDGSITYYQIWGQEVYCEVTGETVRLTEDEVRMLYTLLMQIADPE